MMLGHRQAELGHGRAAIGQESLAKCRVDPGLRDNAGAVPWHPDILREMAKLLDGFGCLHAALVEHRLNRIDAILHGRGALNHTIVIGHVDRSSKCTGFTSPSSIPRGF